MPFKLLKNIFKTKKRIPKIVKISPKPKKRMSKTMKNPFKMIKIAPKIMKRTVKATKRSPKTMKNPFRIIKRVAKIMKRSIKATKRSPKTIKILFKTAYNWDCSMNCVMEGIFFSADSWKIETKTFFPRIKTLSA